MTPASAPFVGIQMASESRRGDLHALCADVRRQASVNALVCFFAANEVRRDPDELGAADFRQKPAELDAHGRDLFDRLHEAAAEHGMAIHLGGGESPWHDKGGFPGFERIAQIDCHGERKWLSCVNQPEWRRFQCDYHAAVFRAHPFLAGFLFMHERSGPFQPLTYPDEWQGSFSPACFCEHCRDLGARRGIDADRAAAGFRRLVTIFRDRPVADVRDGVFVAFLRTVAEFPEVMAWEKLQWDSLHRYRQDVAAAIRGARPGATIGYHFQHAGATGNLSWRAGDDPGRARDFADWVKASVYPGVSGRRYAAALRRQRVTWLADFDEETSHRAMEAWFGRPGTDEGRGSLCEATAPTMAADTQGDACAEGPQSAFGPGWVETETRRITEGCAPLPHYAGLGIGVPGGEEADTVELIRDCTEACFRGGAQGILLSRHHHEMRPELLRAAGDVIRAHFRL